MNFEIESAFAKDFRKLKNRELVIIEKNIVTFVAFAHRKEIYNRFP